MYDMNNIDPFKKDELLQAVEKLRCFIENINIRKSCGSCIHYMEREGHCNKNGQKVPERILKTGCNCWEFDDIPF